MATEQPPEETKNVKSFQPRVLDKTVIALPLLQELEAEEKARKTAKGRKPPLKLYEVIIDLNLDNPGGRAQARTSVEANIKQAKKNARATAGGLEADSSGQYLFARLQGPVIRELVRLDGQNPPRAIFRIWPDFEVSAFITKSVATIKADAARNSFGAIGEGITWAVLDTGISREHAHFKAYDNLSLGEGPVDHGALRDAHRDFTEENTGPLVDENGHGTHVAGILAGMQEAAEGRKLVAIEVHRDENDDVKPVKVELDEIRGVAPKCKIVSLKVLNSKGKGKVRYMLKALAYVQEMNGNGVRLRIHGINMSLGHRFEPEWFACGQSPLCVEIDRLVKSGVVVVVAAGNTGYGFFESTIAAASSVGMDVTINDPGNADLAITVGSTHRFMPHVYGVSYFSSKGPTGDGRLKPDLVAPGEKIVSCATGQLKKDGARNEECDYVETSGTSMAAPHVSGAIAAFLSVRTEFIGRAERVKEIFVSTATDLKRDRYFQGAGLLDLMRAIQSV
jgi:serine protease AprX